MDIKLSITTWLILTLLFACNESYADNRKTCQGPSYVTGGSLDQMVGQLFPCDAEQNSQTSDNVAIIATDEQIQEPVSDDTRYDPERSKQIAMSVLDLSQRITENILAQSKRKYEILSPISIASALQLTLLAAHGVTFNELMDLMDYNTKSFSRTPYQIHEEFGLLIEDMMSNSPSEHRYRDKVPWRTNASKEYQRRAMKFQSNKPNYDEHKISVANGIFVQQDYSIRNEYKNVVEGIYQGQIERLDFRNKPQESAKFINNWVNEKTNGKIKEIIPGSANPETRVILANAIYFKADWQETFIDGATMPKKFFPYGRDSNDSIEVELMAHGGKFPHYYDPESDCEILGLPYKQNSTTMYVVLPKNSDTEKVKAAQRFLTAEKIESMISKMVIKTAVILFPKMHLTSGHCLKANLKDLGLETLFDARKSDLSVMSEGLERKPIQFQSASSRPSSPPRNNRTLERTDDLSEQLIFGRSNIDGSDNRPKRDVTYKTESISEKKENALNFKDFMLRKRIVKKIDSKKLKRSKRQSTPYSGEKLDMIRNMKNLKNPYLFAEEVIHKVDLTVNEKGTEGGAATAITLNRSGTSVVFRVDVPFMFLIRHDPTRVPLFYGAVFEPEN